MGKMFMMKVKGRVENICSYNNGEKRNYVLENLFFLYIRCFFIYVYLLIYIYVL